MRHYLDQLPARDDPVGGALERLGAIGRGYVLFAASEPGLFRTAFCATSDDHAPGVLPRPSRAHRSGAWSRHSTSW